MILPGSRLGRRHSRLTDDEPRKGITELPGLRRLGDLDEVGALLLLPPRRQVEIPGVRPPTVVLEEFGAPFDG